MCITLAIFVCAFVGHAYSTRLDFFPWGNASRYLIFGLLIGYFIIPCCLFIGVIRFLINVKQSAYLPKISFFLISLLLYIPLSIGIDDKADVIGRWSGVITALISILLLLLDFKCFMVGEESDE